MRPAGIFWLGTGLHVAFVRTCFCSEMALPCRYAFHRFIKNNPRGHPCVLRRLFAIVSCLPAGLTVAGALRAFGSEKLIAGGDGRVQELFAGFGLLIEILEDVELRGGRSSVGEVDIGRKISEMAVEFGFV